MPEFKALCHSSDMSDLWDPELQGGSFLLASRLEIFLKLYEMFLVNRWTWYYQTVGQEQILFGYAIFSMWFARVNYNCCGLYKFLFHDIHAWSYYIMYSFIVVQYDQLKNVWVFFFYQFPLFLELLNWLLGTLVLVCIWGLTCTWTQQCLQIFCYGSARLAKEAVFCWSKILG